MNCVTFVCIALSIPLVSLDHSTNSSVNPRLGGLLNRFCNFLQVKTTGQTTVKTRRIVQVGEFTAEYPPSFVDEGKASVQKEFFNITRYGFAGKRKIHLELDFLTTNGTCLQAKLALLMLPEVGKYFDISSEEQTSDTTSGGVYP